VSGASYGMLLSVSEPNRAVSRDLRPAHNRHCVRFVTSNSGVHKCRYVRVRKVVVWNVLNSEVWEARDLFDLG
jgi:hypothetical protein